MKKISKFPFFLLAMAFAMFSAFAFNVKPSKSLNTSVTYRYIGNNSLTQMQDPEKWIEDDSQCITEGDYPCLLVYPNADREEFDAHVQAFPSIPQVVLESASTRE